MLMSKLQQRHHACKREIPQKMSTKQFAKPWTAILAESLKEWMDAQHAMHAVHVRTDKNVGRQSKPEVLVGL